MSTRRRRFLASTLVMIVSIGAASSVSADPAVPFTNDSVDKVTITGSPVSYRLVHALAQAYMESEGCLLADASFPLTAASPTQNTCQAPSAQTGQVSTENHDHDVLISYFPQEKTGVRQLCAQRTTPARDGRVPYIDLVHTLSRPAGNGKPIDGFACTVANGGQSGVVLRFIAFARDGMSWVRWPGGTRPDVLSLRQYELHDIFVTCFITHWNQVQATYNGEFYPAPSGEPIRVFTATPQSDERAMWDGFVGGASDSCIPNVYKDGDLSDGERVVAANDAHAVEQAVNDPAAAQEGNSIYYFSTARHAAGPAMLRGASMLGNIDVSSTGAIEPVAPNEANIASGVFPMSRNVYLVLRNSGTAPVASGAVRRFANFGTTANDQALGWLCKPDAAHSEPIGTPGPGIEIASASRDYGAVPGQAIRAQGFVPLPEDPATGRRCQFTDVTVT